MCPLPSVGEGSSDGLTKRMGEGDHTKTGVTPPHPSIAFKISSCPLPRRGEGKITTASAASNFSDAVVIAKAHAHVFIQLRLERRRCIVGWVEPIKLIMGSHRKMDGFRFFCPSEDGQKIALPILRSAKQRPARPYSITSSAIARSAALTSRPRVVAVLRLMINSNREGNPTAMSPGFSPLRMRSIKPATRG